MKHKFDIEDEKESIKISILRISKELGKTPTQKEYKEYRNKEELSVEQIFYRYGKWSDALKAAGLNPNPFQKPPHQLEIEEDELIKNFIQVSNSLGKIPAANEFRVHSRYSWTPYKRKWGSWNNVIKHFISKYKDGFSFRVNLIEDKEAIARRKKFLFECPLIYEPINEFETIALFCFLAKELGYKIRSIRSDFPDGILEKDGKEILVEFEFLSSNYLQHCHPKKFNGLCICWRKDVELGDIKIFSLEEYIRNKHST